MPFTFFKGGVQQAFFGFLSVFLKWAILSGIISLALIFTGVLATLNLGTTITLQTLTSANPVSVLTQYPQFRYLNYVELLWAGYLLPVIFGGIFYSIILAQKAPQERILDFYHNVAGKTIVLTGAVIVLWILVGGYYLLMYQAPILQNNTLWQNITTQGLEGLSQIKMTSPITLKNVVMNIIFPYFPIPILALGYIFILGNIHGGSMGNEYTEVGQ